MKPFIKSKINGAMVCTFPSVPYSVLSQFAKQIDFENGDIMHTSAVKLSELSGVKLPEVVIFFYNKQQVLRYRWLMQWPFLGTYLARSLE